jgi:4'-phosphopantetheinyl transferase
VDDERAEAFLACWTRKEAFLKAVGDGLGRGLDSFEVSVDPHEPARLLRVFDDPSEATRWSMHALIPAAGYVGALVIEGNDCVVTCLKITAI